MAAQARGELAPVTTEQQRQEITSPTLFLPAPMFDLDNRLFGHHVERTAD